MAADRRLLPDALPAERIAGLREAALALGRAAASAEDRRAAAFGLSLVGEIERQTKIAGVWKDVAKLAFARLARPDREGVLADFRAAFLRLDAEHGPELARLFGMWVERQQLPAPRRGWRRWLRLPWRR